ncbi:MAG: hypothetical protein II725_03750, partial [Firmicutes bacterium]|nr:hypothetical protein [Bacillota bacterium]
MRRFSKQRQRDTIIYCGPEQSACLTEPRIIKETIAFDNKGNPMLEVKNVVFAPEGDRKILNDVSIQVPDGK